MANTIEFVIKTTDQATEIIGKIEAKTVASSEAMVKSFSDVGAASEQAAKKFEESGSAAGESAKGFESFAGKLVSIQAGIGIAKEAIAGLKEVWDFAKQGAENQRIAESFNRTAESIGANADEIIKKLDEAARGTVDDEELMQASTRALTLGVAKSGDDLVNVMRLARAAAIQFGGDAGQAFEAINQAIGNLAPRALKQFGIIVDLKDANEAYAKSLGISAAALTDEQQRQALLNAVLEQGAKNFKDIGDSATTTAEKMKAVETRLGNIIDIFKETAATGIDTIFTVSDAPKNALDAFNGTVAKMKEEVQAGRMSVQDYNNAVRDMGRTIAPLIGIETGAIVKQELLNESVNHYADATDGAIRAARQFADVQGREVAEKQAAAKNAAQKHTDVMRAYSAQLLASVEAYQSTKISIADTTILAIEYTEAQKKQAEVQAKLDALNEQIASHGARRSVTIKNEKLSTDELAKTQAALAVAQEDLSGATRKSGETEAEFALRVETLKGKVVDYSQKLGEHTAVVGGATKAEQEQKKALEEQIAALQKASEIDKAKGAFDALTQSFKDGIMTEDQYKERAQALNAISGLYTDSALKQATSQEVLMKSFADPRSEAWRKQLDANKTTLDGLTDAEAEAATKAEILASSKTLEEQTTAAQNYRNELDKIPREVTTTVTIKTGDEAAKAVAGDTMAERRAQAEKMAGTVADSASAIGAATSKTIGAVSDVASRTTDKVKGVADATETRMGTLANNVLTKFSGAASNIVTAFSSMNTQASGDISSIIAMVDKLPTYKEFIYKITVKGELPEGAPRPSGIPGAGAQRGADFIVPTGFPNDTFPLRVSSGERVTVQTPAQQAGSIAPRAGDTYNYVTNVYNPLAAAMLADKQRRERLARSNSRMGVT